MFNDHCRNYVVMYQPVLPGFNNETNYDNIIDFILAQVNKYHGMGRYEQARQASEKARSYSKMSIIIGIILHIVGGVFFGVIVYFRVAAINATNSYSSSNGYYG